MKFYISIILMSLFFYDCSRHTELPITESNDTIPFEPTQAENKIIKKVPELVMVEKDITMKKYFTYLDSIVSKNPILSGMGLGEYVFVLHNSWIIDSLRGFDYYQQKARGKFLYDLSQQVIFHKGDRLLIPDSTTAAGIIKKLKSNCIDLNIPEFRMRVIRGEDTVLSCLVRVGRNAEEYLPTVGRVVNLRTPQGAGEIVNVLRTPIFYNLQTGEKYDSTKRDDGRFTRMPAIPSLEPVINGVRYGYMFHATTNMNTLGKAYSHGCIGMSEADTWSLYYYAPVGTKVNFRYDLNIINEQGDSVRLRNVYKFQSKVK